MSRGIGNLGALLLTVLLATAIVLGGGMFYSDLYSHYGVASTNASSELQIQQANTKLNQSVNSMASSLQSSSTNQNAFTIIFNGASQGVFQIFNIASVIIDYLGGSAGYLTGLGVDVNWFFAILIGLIAAYFVLTGIEIGLGRQV